LQDALNFSEDSTGGIDSSLPRIEMQEDREIMTILFDLLGALLKENLVPLLDCSRKPLLDSSIAPLARLADKYNVTGLVKAAFSVAALDRNQTASLFQCLILGIATKDPTFCRLSVGRFTFETVNNWKQEEAQVIGLSVYWALVQSTQLWMETEVHPSAEDEYEMDWRAISEMIDWNKALNL
jgi:hypothetical protein